MEKNLPRKAQVNGLQKSEFMKSIFLKGKGKECYLIFLLIFSALSYVFVAFLFRLEFANLD